MDTRGERGEGFFSFSAITLPPIFEQEEEEEEGITELREERGRKPCIIYGAYFSSSLFLFPLSPLARFARSGRERSLRL